MKKIAIIGTVGIPSKYGGFETLTEYLTKYLGKRYDITVFCSANAYKQKPETHNNAKLIYIDLDANGVQSILYDIKSILMALHFADTILILGVSGAIILPFVKLFSRKKIIVNIDGLEWKRNKWRWYAQKFLKFSEAMAVKFSDVVISDNKVIQEYVYLQYDKKSELIAYGSDHVKKLPLSNVLLKKYPFLKEEYAFTVCRIEPENNIDMILESFSIEQKTNIVIVGNWQSNNYGQTMRKKYTGYKNIFLLDPIYDQNILDQIRSNCKMYMHGHSAGGTNPSLVEAMYLELPIVAYSVDYNRETTKGEAVYFDDKNDLVKVLGRFDNEELKDIGKNMKKIIQENYTWDKISQAYSKLF